MGFVRGWRPAPARDPLQRRLDAGRSFLRESLEDPETAEVVALALRAGLRSPARETRPAPRELLAQLRRALEGGPVIRVASPAETRDANFDALTIADDRSGRVEIVVYPSAPVLSRAPPGLLAAVLLREFARAEFRLGRAPAQLVEGLYYGRLIALAPALAQDPDAAFLEKLRKTLTRSLQDKLRAAPRAH